MKSFLKSIFGILLIVFLVGATTFIIDNARAAVNKRPLAAILMHTLKDGGTKEYYGLGYKVIAYNKLNGYNKTHIGPFWLKYDNTLGEEAELATLCKSSVEQMDMKDTKNLVVFESKEIKNKEKFFEFLDAVEMKDTKRHELKFVTTTKEGDKIKHVLFYENESMYYSVDYREDRHAEETLREAVITYELKPLILTRQSEDKKTTTFIGHKLNNDEIQIVSVPQSHLRQGN